MSKHKHRELEWTFLSLADAYMPSLHQHLLPNMWGRFGIKTNCGCSITFLCRYDKLGDRNYSHQIEEINMNEKQ